MCTAEWIPCLSYSWCKVTSLQIWVDSGSITLVCFCQILTQNKSHATFQPSNAALWGLFYIGVFIQLHDHQIAFTLLIEHGCKQLLSQGRAWIHLFAIYYSSCLEITNTPALRCVAAEPVFPAHSNTRSISLLLLPRKKALWLQQVWPSGKSRFVFCISGDLLFVLKFTIQVYLCLSQTNFCCVLDAL